MATVANDQLDPALTQRDPAYIASVLPYLTALFEHYHQATVDGFEHLPEGPALIVGNHNGGTMSPDMFALMVAYWRRFGAGSPAYGLAHDVGFKVPGLGAALRKVGAVPARPEHAEALLKRGAKVLVYPGGDIDAFRSSSRKNEVVFGERTGFIKVALRAGVPIVPVVAAGAHDCFHVLTDGTGFARRSGFKRLTRIEVFPVILSAPFGLMIGPFTPYVPLPVTMKLRLLPPIRFDDLGPEALGDRDAMLRCQRRVRGVMQTALDELVAEGGVGRRW